MFSKIINLLVCALVFNITANAQTWIDFNRNTPAEPEFVLTSSNNQSVTFSMTLPGMSVETKSEGNVLFKRLSLPGCHAEGAIGSPELPTVIAAMIAIPECSGISYMQKIVKQ
jgi:hypothetical protein